MSAWWVIYLIPLLTLWTWQVTRRRHVASKSRDAHLQAQRSGLNEPVSLHPTINAALCVENGVLQLAEALYFCQRLPVDPPLGLLV